MAKAHERKKLHAIILPLPYQGHINPLLNLALKLATKGFKVTFINTQYAHHCITQSMNTEEKNSGSNFQGIDIFAEARNFSGLDIDYRTVSDGFPLDYDRAGNFAEFWEYLLEDFFPDIIGDFVGQIIEESSSSTSSSFTRPIIVADTFARWAAQIAEKYDLVIASFWTQPSLVFAANYYKDLLAERGHFPRKDDKLQHNIDYIPGVESISSKDLPSHFESKAPPIMQKIVFSSFDLAKKADFVLHNTVQELEPVALSSLNGTLPTYSVGPTNFFEKRLKTLGVPTSLLTETDCSRWLDEKPSGSVLYVSFGSIVHADEHVIEEIARGLVLSGANFLWITRNHGNNGGSSGTEEGIGFPTGFRDGVKGKGLIVPWCDQRAVLSHRATGGFLTHCGWNSVLESMWFGVPMICYPLDYDQPTNRKLVVDDWKIGTNLYDEEGAIDGEKLAEKIKKLMDVTTGENEMRREMKKVTKILHDALDENGSSETNFDRFVVDLKLKIHG